MKRKQRYRSATLSLGCSLPTCLYACFAVVLATGTPDLDTLLITNETGVARNAIRYFLPASSKLFPCIQEVNANGSLVVCWDPLDGSSIIDCNWSVASIFGIWRIGENGLQWNGPDTLINSTGGGLPLSVLEYNSHCFCVPTLCAGPCQR